MNDTTITNRYNVADRPPAINQRVRAYNVAAPAYEGHETIVTGGHSGIAYGEFVSISKPDDTIRLSFTSYEEPLAQWERELLGEAPAQEPRPSEETGIITDLQQQVERLTRERDQARESAQAYSADFAAVGEALMEEAIQRDWCSEYDEFVDRVNSQTKRLDLPIREQEYEVEVTVSGYIETTTTVTVTAYSQENADKMVAENMDNYIDADDVLTNASRSESFSNIECEVQ